MSYQKRTENLERLKSKVIRQKRSGTTLQNEQTTPNNRWKFNELENRFDIVEGFYNSTKKNLEKKLDEIKDYKPQVLDDFHFETLETIPNPNDCEPPLSPNLREKKLSVEKIKIAHLFDKKAIPTPPKQLFEKLIKNFSLNDSSDGFSNDQINENNFNLKISSDSIEHIKSQTKIKEFFSEDNHTQKPQNKDKAINAAKAARRKKASNYGVFNTSRLDLTA